MENAIEIKNLSKSYEDFCLNHICLFDYLFISS